MEGVKNNYELYNKLLKIDSLKNKLKIADDKIEIIFHENFKLEVTCKNYFNVYINGYFYYDVEPQDIYKSLEEIANNTFIIVERKSINLFNRKKFIFFELKKFEKHKAAWLNKGLKIFSTEGLISNL